MERKKDIKVLLKAIDWNTKQLHEMADELDANKEIDIETAKIRCDIVRLRAVEMLNHFREMEKEASN